MAELTTRTKVLLGTLATVCLLACVSALVNWYSNDTPTPSHTYVSAKPIAGLGTIPKVSVALPSIQVIPKDIAVKKLPQLPEEIKTNEDVEVLNTAVTPASEIGFNIVSTVNKKDGSTGILIRERERSLIEFVNKRRIGIAYGISTVGGAQTAKISGEWSFLRVGNTYVSTQAEIRTKQLQNTEGVAYISVDYRW